MDDSAYKYTQLSFENLITQAMDFPTHLAAIFGLVALLVLYYFQRIKAVNSTKGGKKSSRTLVRAPQPSGALPLVGHLHLLGGETPVARTLGAMAEKHGPIFTLRLGSHQALVVSGWEFVKECFTTNDTNFASRPAMAVTKYLGYGGAMFALAPYGPYWRDVRKIVTLELFTASRLEKLRHVRESEVDLCIKDLYLLWSKNGDFSAPAKVAINKWFEHLTFNVIVRMLAGKRVSGSTGGHGDAEEGRFKEAVKRALFLSGLFVVSDAIPWLEWLDFGGYLEGMKQTSKAIDAVLGDWVEGHIRKRMEEGERSDDFIDVMLSVLGKENLMSGFDRDTIIKATTMILVLTGSESTAETLIWALSLLLNNRHALKTAQEELDVHVGRDRWVQETDIANLKYLRAIVKETLRLYPPGPLAGPREAIEDCLVSGFHVRKGTRLIVNLWKLQRDSRIWSDPNEFKPERFMGHKHAEVGYRGQQFEYIPFSSGRRMCPGVTFGLQVVHLVLARLLHGFHLTTPLDEPVDMTEGVGLALPKVHPLEVLLMPRLPVEFYQTL